MGKGSAAVGAARGWQRMGRGSGGVHTLITRGTSYPGTQSKSSMMRPSNGVRCHGPYIKRQHTPRGADNRPSPASTFRAEERETKRKEPLEVRNLLATYTMAPRCSLHVPYAGCTRADWDSRLATTPAS